MQSLVVESQLHDLLSRSDLERLDKLLLCLAVDIDSPKQIRDIRTLAHSHGLRAAKTWNISTYLSRSDGKAVRVGAGWILSQSGRRQVASISPSAAQAVASHAASALRDHLAKLSNADTRGFVEEAIACFIGGQFRAATVLSWVGAVSLLYDHVIATCLAKFNAEAARRNVKHKTVANRDDLTRLKESDFLDYLEGCSVIGKSVRKELGVCLDLRNGCGHPSSLKVAESRVAAHIETLLLNVYSKF